MYAWVLLNSWKLHGTIMTAPCHTMNVGLCVFLCVCMCVGVCVCLCVCSRVYTHINVYIHTYIYVCIHTYIHTHIFICIHTCIYIYTHMYIHTSSMGRLPNDTVKEIKCEKIWFSKGALLLGDFFCVWMALLSVELSWWQVFRWLIEFVIRVLMTYHGDEFVIRFQMTFWVRARVSMTRWIGDTYLDDLSWHVFWWFLALETRVSMTRWIRDTYLDWLTYSWLDLVRRAIPPTDAARSQRGENWNGNDSTST